MLPTQLTGTVTPFQGNGRKLGYPTANINTGTALADGVYFGYASLGDLRDQPALIFIGTPTTVGDRGRRVEAHVLDVPDQDYYGQPLALNIQYFHRPNQTFDTIEALLVAMRADEAAGRSWLAANPLASSE